jgi:F-type H+-transporting ATPase subunit delta
MLSVVGARYAKALLEVVGKQDPQKTLAELRQVSGLIAASGDLRNALLSPAVPPARKRAVIARLIEPMGVSTAVRNFLFVVIDHRRTSQLPSIVEAFDVLLDERMGFVRASVASAHELDGTQRASLEAELTRISGKRAKVAYATDTALIGGVVARISGKVYDGSVRGQLERLRSKLVNS